jgi:antitoxin component YwqK of YwqJK toxin-antitoxin module
MYFLNGQLRYEGTFDDMQYIGYGTEYYENGQLKFKGTFHLARRLISFTVPVGMGTGSCILKQANCVLRERSVETRILHLKKALSIN